MRSQQNGNYPLTSLRSLSGSFRRDPTFTPSSSLAAYPTQAETHEAEIAAASQVSACADTTLVLDRDQNGITLYVRGRDVEEKESALNFTAGYWSLIGDAAEVRRSDERSVIADFLADNPEPITPTEMAAALGWKLNNTKQLLYKMAKAGQIVRSSGRYSTIPR